MGREREQDNRQPAAFFLETDTQTVNQDNPIWQRALPTSPAETNRGPAGDNRNQPATYGELFLAVSDFLQQPETWRPLNTAMPRWPRIMLVKHGAFYHPCRIETEDTGQAFVVNVAVSEPGQAAIEGEFTALAKLGQNRAAGFVPEVYHLGHGRTATGKRLPMFLGQWLEGFWEFHLGFHNNRLEVLVWDPIRGRRPLNPMQVRQLFRQSAFILAACYDPISMEAVSGFHQAAGDLVVKPGRGDRLHTRLVSVRKYQPMTASPPADFDLHTVLDGLLVLLLKTSLQLRLDRIDGVGDFILYPSAVVGHIWQGFAEGIAWSLKTLDMPTELARVMVEYFRGHDLGSWIDLAGNWLQLYPDGSREKSTLENGLENHLARLLDAVRKQTGNRF